jgi:DNA-binding phage protein
MRRGYHREAVNCLLPGDLDTGRAVLRKYVNFTVGFAQLVKDLKRNPKTLMRMFRPKGNPQARNLFAIVVHLQKLEGAVLEVMDRQAA